MKNEPLGSPRRAGLAFGSDIVWAFALGLAEVVAASKNKLPAEARMKNEAAYSASLDESAKSQKL